MCLTQYLQFIDSNQIFPILFFHQCVRAKRSIVSGQSLRSAIIYPNPMRAQSCAGFIKFHLECSPRNSHDLLYYVTLLILELNRMSIIIYHTPISHFIKYLFISINKYNTSYIMRLSYLSKNENETENRLRQDSNNQLQTFLAENTLFYFLAETHTGL